MANDAVRDGLLGSLGSSSTSGAGVSSFCAGGTCSRAAERSFGDEDAGAGRFARLARLRARVGRNVKVEFEIRHITTLLVPRRAAACASNVLCEAFRADFCCARCRAG